MEKTRVILDLPTKSVGHFIHMAIDFGASLQAISKVVEANYTENQPSKDPRLGVGKTFSAIEKALRDGPKTSAQLSKICKNPYNPIRTLLKLGKVKKNGNLYSWSAK